MKGHGGDLEVELVDEPETRTVEVGPRRRWRELVLAVVAVSAVVGVGLIDSGGDDDDVGSAPTTTTTNKPSRTRITTHRQALASRSTTTTSWPQREAGEGPLLPGGPTATAIGVISGSGRVKVVDLDTGDRCETQPAGQGVWMPWGLRSGPGRMLVQTPEALLAIDRTCAIVSLAANVGDLYLAAISDDSVWLAGGNSPYLNEVRLSDGEPTGRTVEIPRFNTATAVAVGDDILLSAMGDLTLVDPDTGERTALGTGMLLAVHDTTVAYSSCPKARCQLGLLDVTTGQRRIVAGVEPTGWHTSSFSADGRLLQVPVAGSRSDQPVAAIVNPASGIVRIVDEPVQQAVFTTDNQWMIATTNSGTTAYRVDGTTDDVELDDLRSGQGIVAL